MRNIKFFLSILFAFCLLMHVHAQARKFPAPSLADTMTNPLKGNTGATVQGQVIYTKFCVTCHGARGKGDGIAAPGLPKPPADHTSAFVQNQKDGAIYWVITKGNNPMPGYSAILTAEQRWEVVNYIRTLAKKK